MSKFFNELKRRNVIKATIAYIVVAWVLLQVLSTILPAVEAPDWVFKTLMILMVIGFPIWVIFSWVYEVTSEGLKKTAQESEDNSVTAITNKRLDIIIIITLIIAIAVSFFNKPISVSETTSESVVNDSSDKENSYFINGIMEEILINLQTIQDLRVISRNSVEQYRGPEKPTIPEIAQKLGVNYIVEGSVQKYGNTIRLRVQLIRADKESHLWAKSYEQEIKEVNDMFRIQSQIAEAIAAELKAVITPREKQLIEKIPTKNLAAYEANLKGLKSWEESYNIEGLKIGVEYFKQAIKLDSTYANAYANLSAAYIAYPYFCESTPLEALELAEPLNNIALRLNPDLTMAHINQFHFLYYIKWDWEASLRIISEAKTLSLNDPMVLDGFLYYYVISGKFDQAFEIIEKIHQISPSESIYWINKIYVQFHSRDLEGVLRTAEEGLKLFPDNGNILEMQMWSFSLLGRHDEAVKAGRKIITNDQGFNPIHLGEVGAVLARAGLKEEALEKLETIKELNLNYFDPVSIGLLYMGLGDKDLAMKYFEEGYNTRSGWMPYLKRGPPFDSMRGDPRFEKLIQNLKFP